MTGMTDKMWVNSGDAHVLEPPDLWKERMPAEMAARMPRSEKIDERTERVHIDGQSFERKIGLNPVLTEEDLEAAGVGTRGRQGGHAILREVRAGRRGRMTSSCGSRTSTRRGSGGRSCIRRSGCGTG